MLTSKIVESEWNYQKNYSLCTYVGFSIFITLHDIDRRFGLTGHIV